MDREAIRRKIKNLLALADSDNENEAVAAAQAARKLMMKYHISVEGDRGKERIQKGVVISRTFYKLKPVSCTCFMGFEEDAHAALMLMEYLVRFMEQGAKAYGGSESQEYCWRDGFCVGVSEAFKEQDREEPGYEIMTAIPQEVNDAFGKLKIMKRSDSGRMDYRALDGAAFSCGKNSGRRAVDGGRISRD